MHPKKIYSLCRHGVPIDAGTTRELADRLKTSKEVISNYARDGLTYKGQYTFREVGVANEKTAAAMKWAKEWDEVVKRIKTAGEVIV